MNENMKKALEAAQKGSHNHEGGPFGAVIVDKTGKIIAQANNQVLKNNDPTAHAEIMAIREACQKLGTHDLTGYSIYTSCEPCPMCLSANIWSNITTVYYACTRADAAKIGFRDDQIYCYLAGEQKDLLSLITMDREECLKVFEQYEKENGTIY